MQTLQILQNKKEIIQKIYMNYKHSRIISVLCNPTNADGKMAKLHPKISRHYSTITTGILKELNCK